MSAEPSASPSMPLGKGQNEAPGIGQHPKERGLSPKAALLLIVLVPVAVASAISHLAAHLIQFRTDAVIPLVFGATNLPVSTTAAGSSLTFFGINWSDVSKALNSRVRGWAVPGGSVEEMGVLQGAAPPARFTFLGISPHDLDDNFLSEFHADVVPLGQTISSLRAAHMDWKYTKRVTSQYPLKYLRVLFPTAGRSTHVMVGIRTALRALRHRGSAEPSERAVIDDQANTHQDSITSWSAAHKLRQIADLRAGNGIQFGGPKRDALFRFLDRAVAQGKMIVMVLPESPSFRHEEVTPGILQQFEALLAEAQKRAPQAIWVRLDRLPELQTDTCFWDLVHMNAAGQALATKALLAQLAQAGVSPK